LWGEEIYQMSILKTTKREFNRLKNIYFENTLAIVISIGIICLVIIACLIAYKPEVKVWNVPDDVENAYASIPKGSVVLNLPIYGDEFISLSSPKQSYYRGNASVGWTDLYVYEYEVNKYGLKDAYAPPSDWEVPFMTKWFFDIVDQKMAQWNDTIGAVDLLNLAPDLQYIVVYKEIMPASILNSLNTSNQLQMTFENQTMSVYKRINSIVPPVMESNKAFLLYSGSYQYSLPSLAALANGQIPVLMGQTTDKLFNLNNAKDMQNLTITTQDTTLADIATEYAIANIKDKTLIDLANTLKTSETDWVSSDFWQPSLGQLTISSDTPGVIHNTTFSLNASGSYDIYIRVPCNGPWRGNLQILLDGQKIGEGYSPADAYGYEWFQVTTTNLGKGKHTLGFLDTEAQWIDVNAVAILNPAEFTANLQKYEGELQSLVAQDGYLGIYEAETSYSNLNGASVSGDFNQDWVMYPSGGWTTGESVEIQPTMINAVTIPVEAPISGNYSITVREKGVGDMTIDGQVSASLQTQTSGTWDYETYNVYLTAGNHVLEFSNHGSESAYLDTVYVSNQPLSQILNHENPKVTITTINDGKYVVDSSSDQPRYVILMKSYFPLWDEDSNGKNQEALLTNGFLSGFYISSKTYTIKFK
jgi:hypothetical protein